MAAAQANTPLSRASVEAADAVIGARRVAVRLVGVAGFETAVGDLAAVGIAAGRVGGVVDEARQLRVADRGPRPRRQPGQAGRRLAILEGLDATQRVVHAVRGLMARVVGDPGLPASFFL